MDSLTIRRAEEVFSAAADLTTSRRRTLLDEQCAGDPALRDLVEELLDDCDAAQPGTLDRPLFGDAPSPLDPRPPEPAPARIGRYELIRPLGEGGMAVVYEARQENPRRTVALKVIRAGVLLGESMRRFQHEVHVLGQLRHPAIAHIYEAAVAEIRVPEGLPILQPYFAMELVRGEPLTVFAARHDLPIPERLDLVARICDAVHYAHQKGVIHRDLKPANILVEPAEAPGRPLASPKILDFGVARVVGSDFQAKSMATAQDQIVGTLAYMSPEQLDGQVEHTDTRSDVYALGVILYELLAGRLPHDVSGAVLPEAARRLRENDPPALGSLDPRLRGDPEVIVARAMEKDPARRYPSASELAADLRRHLRGEAIEARRDSTIYVLAKGLRRHRTPLAAFALALGALIAFAGYAWSQALQFRHLSAREHAARLAAEDAQALADASARTAQHETAKARRVSRFLQGVLELSKPKPGKRNLPSVTDALDDATQRLAEGALADEPDVEAEVRRTLARVYNSLQLSAAAIPHARWLVGHQRVAAGDLSHEHVGALFSLAGACIEASQLPEAEAALRRILDIAPTVYGADSQTVINAMNTLGNCLMRQSKNQESLPYALAAVDGNIRLNGPDHLESAFARFNLAGLYRNLGRWDDAAANYLAALAVFEIKAPRSLTTIRCRRFFAADCLARQPALDQAAEHLTATIARAIDALGVDHPETLETQRVLADLLIRKGDPDAAIALLTPALDICRAMPRWVIRSEGNISGAMVRALLKQGRVEEADQTAQTTLDRLERLQDPLDATTIAALESLAAVKKARGDLPAARACVEDLLRRAQEKYGPEDARTAAIRQRAASLLKPAN